MAGLKFEDILEGASNFCPEMECLSLVLEKNGLLKFVEGKAVPPADRT